MTPQRVQLRRTKGWRKPDNTIVVSRPSKWGNPFPVSTYGRDYAVIIYHTWILITTPGYGREVIQRELAGRDLACWCPLDQPCHADVLLEIANKAA